MPHIATSDTIVLRQSGRDLVVVGASWAGLDFVGVISKVDESSIELEWRYEPATSLFLSVLDSWDTFVWNRKQI